MKTRLSVLFLLASAASAQSQQPARPARPPVPPAPPPPVVAPLPAPIPWEPVLPTEWPVWDYVAPDVEWPIDVVAPDAFEWSPLDFVAPDVFEWPTVDYVTPGIFEWPGLDYVTPDAPEWPVGLEVAPQAPVAWTVPGFARQEPQDSLYTLARRLLNQGEYRRAAELFQQYERANQASRYAAAALYWRAFALYRAGTSADLQQAIVALDQQRQRFAEAAADADVQALRTRITGTLAARGDAEAARRLRERADQGNQACDREDMEVRAEALNALVQLDTGGSRDLLARVLARRDECSAPLRRRAVYLLGREAGPDAATLLLDVAKNDPDRAVRTDAISRLARIPGEGTLRNLETLFNESTDEATQRAVLQSVRWVESGDPSRLLRRAIERDDLAETVRAEAVRSLARAGSGGLVQGRQGEVIVSQPAERAVEVASQARELADRVRVLSVGQLALARGSTLSDSNAAYLRALYPRASSRAVRSAILETIARAGGQANDQWLMDIVRDPNEEIRNRALALSQLRRSETPIEELSRLYESLTERQLRSTLVSILGSRSEPAATDKLIEIARSGTDPSIRRAAISALARKKDPRTEKLLLELLEKP